MTVNVQQANNYLKFHVNGEKWNEVDDEKKTYLLNLAEQYIENYFSLRDGYKDSTNFQHAIIEQAIHMLTMDKERLQLQKEGVTTYKVDDMSFQMDSSFISPVVKSFLKRYIYVRVGEIV